jgi:hypothetical protein
LAFFPTKRRGKIEKNRFSVPCFLSGLKEIPRSGKVEEIPADFYAIPLR